MFTRETKVVLAVVLALGVLIVGVLLVTPQWSIYAARCEGEATRIRARASADADVIRAKGFFRADTSRAGATSVLLKLKEIEAAR